MAAPPSIRDTFFEECEDLLAALSEGLAQMESGNDDPETVNAVFRAVHSIKGGAGAFALDRLVGFAHGFETVLDALRAGQIPLSPDLMRVLLRSADHLADHVEAARENREIPPEATSGFVGALGQFLGADLTLQPEVDEDPCFGFAALPLDFGPDPLALLEGSDDPGAAAGPGLIGYDILFHPLPGFQANGHDPASVLHALAALGPLTVTADLGAMPAWQDRAAHGAWLGWNLHLSGSVPEAAIHEVFDFLDGLCRLSVTPLFQQAPPAEPAASPDLTPSAPPDPLPPPISALRPRSGEEEPAASGPKPTLRVDLERVERLVNAVGELIINQAMIEQSILDLALPADAEVLSHVEDYRLLARDLQEAVMAIRAQPVKPLFQRMSRILREAAEATGKSARLITQGEATEVDKTVIERLADPLTHMIRNAVDHGLENPAARSAAGKETEGTIWLSAAHRSGAVVITLRDNGAGLNRPRILERAVQRGLIAPDAELSDAEIDNLLFLPGFSTAEKISALSGRGVGLDVVRNAVTALGGRIAISSTPGEGTEFSISLPLTLAVMDGMVISVAGQTMVIPIAPVIETIRPGPGDLHRIGTSETVLAMRGNFLPMIDVAQCLGFGGTSNPAPLLLLVETEVQERCALIVDAVHDQRQVVIKGLDANYGAIPGVSAATVLGDGQIALILDVEALTAQRIPPSSRAA